MDIRLWHIFVMINCVVIIQYSETKTFSLNDAIAAEAQQKQESERTILHELAESTAERFSLNKALISTPIKTRKLKKFENIFPHNKRIISPLKYRKTFQIKSPLKPKKAKYTLKGLHNRKNQSFKREINDNDIFNQKYIPLLRSVGLLFDNIIGPDGSTSNEEIKQDKSKRTRYYSGERDGAECACAAATNMEIKDGKSQEEANTLTTTAPTEISITTEIPVKIETATTAAHNFASGDVSRFRHHKDLPALYPRNSSGTRRDDNGFSARSSAAHNGSFERYIAGNNGDSEYNTESREDASYTESHEENTNGDSRDGTGSDGAGRRLREYRNSAGDNNETSGIEIGNTEIKGDQDHRRANGSERQDQLEMARDEAKSAELLSESVRRLRGPESKIKIKATTELPTTTSEEGIINVPYDDANHKRISDRSSTFATENQEIHTRHETIRTKKSSTDSNGSKTNTPVVVIIDGYSVTRHRNGEKKLARKAIHINPK